MGFLLFLAALGIGYGVASGLFGASEGVSAAAGWALALGGLLLWRWRRRAYRAAFSVERYRAAAEAMRANDPDTYWGIVSQADGSEAEEAARRDPDAYVALFLSAASDLGYGTGTEARS